MKSNCYDVIVVGAGLAGFAAAGAAAQEKLRVAMISTGPGSFVLGAEWPRAQEVAPAADLGEAQAFFAGMAERAGCPLAGDPATPLWLPTVLGGFEPVAMAPARLAKGEPLEGTTTVIVGIGGLSDFDENFMAERLHGQVKPLRSRCSYTARRIALAGDFGTPVTTLRLAQQFDRSPGFRAELLQALRSIADGADCILLPGMLGIHTPEQEIEQFEQDLSCAIGELTTLPPSVPSLRLFHRLEQYLHDAGVELFRGFPVRQLEIHGNVCTGLRVASPGHGMSLISESVVLAAGHGSAELLGVGCAGLDEESRPVSVGGVPVARNLFMAGPLQENASVPPVLAGYRAGKCAAAQRGCYAAG